jgi:hypothetical protein
MDPLKDESAYHVEHVELLGAVDKGRHGGFVCVELQTSPRNQ